jgi:hypothetical protein
MAYTLRVLTVLLALATAVPAMADDVYTFVVKKQEEKKKTRWSLSEWLETRDRMQLMDLWLAMNSPSPYEFFIGGAYMAPSQAGASKGFELQAAAFATIFGLEFSRQSVPSTRTQGIFDLRIFGYHDQSTNITLQAGVASTDAGASSVRGALAGGRMDVYLAKYFGIGGLLRHYFDSTGGVPGGNRYEGQAFIDFRFLRAYGTYYTESGTNGVTVGARLYF